MSAASITRTDRQHDDAYERLAVAMGAVKLLFLPVSIVGGFPAGFLGKKIFDQAWGLIEDRESPEAKHREVEYPKLAGALVLEGAIFRLLRGFFDHGARRGFQRVTGSWPGEEAPQRE